MVILRYFWEYESFFFFGFYFRLDLIKQIISLQCSEKTIINDINKFVEFVLLHL